MISVITAADLKPGDVAVCKFIGGSYTVFVKAVIGDYHENFPRELLNDIEKEAVDYILSNDLNFPSHHEVFVYGRGVEATRNTEYASTHGYIDRSVMFALLYRED